MQEMAQIIFTQGARVVFEKGATAPKNNEKNVETSRMVCPCQSAACGNFAQ